MNPTTAPAPLNLSTIGQIALSVTDIARATAFYRDTLGIRLLFEVSNMAFFDCGGVRLMLSGSAPAGSTSSVIYFKVTNIQESFESLSRRQASIEREPHLVARMPDHELWMAFFRDPDGNLLALMSEVR